MKYIDAEKLFNEIKIIQQSLESRDVRFNQVKKIRTECLIEFCKCITDVIDSLQKEQSEVDLEKEARHYLLHEHSSPLNEIMHQADLKAEIQYHEDIENAYKAGFELGLKAQKGE